MTTRPRSADAQAIISLIEARNRAHRRKEAAAIVAPYASGAVRYDLAPPLLHYGMLRPDVEKWLATWDGPVTVETDDLEVAVDGVLAVAWGLTRMRGQQGGVDQDLWFRMTVVLEKAGDRWRIMHEHTSVPFYMDGSYKAAVDLEPEGDRRA
jgi:ketosteroid isomerase-like protein